jgi:hypothetical protein
LKKDEINQNLKNTLNEAKNSIIRLETENNDFNNSKVNLLLNGFWI